MISLKHQYEDSLVLNDCDQLSNSFLFFNQVTQSQETNATISKSNQKKTHQRRKCIIYGDKDRSSALYKYIKEKQRSYLDSNGKASNSIFYPEEDRILLLLVKKLGPKFSKITKYFPGKTMNMLKNRYYKNLKNSEASIIPKEIEEELAVKDKKKRIMGKKIIKTWPEEQRISALIDNSDLFPEAKEKIQLLLQGFTQIFANLMKNI
ncbi:unnamed protein product (macronuclear) [Paramecium tetraurelia]|uniref:HTH myb-type domain-containing protein n=1 Tax=Paramecium tetraurelia TaxID=5888 RepID=A0C001_PARTE|nr:uncharacterized protein GSPATT00005971001 [Paramecium tetraurelia]CAK64118.1 unnamed protein product [Paramecium tetraurelia]|eukprot:XP_001431516.1 hypothetical protein (macronuclear) [Paramecium tetraurelia strain d4-2]